MDFKPDTQIYQVKCIVLGDSTVGKTALINRYVHGIFSQDGFNTIGISVEIKQIVYKGRKFEINVWDTAGQERYRAIISRHYKDKHGIILTIDLSEPNFENIDYWLGQIQINANKDMPILLVGTKKDLKPDMNLDAMKAFAKAKELPFLATSAKTNENVDMAFETLLNEILFRDIELMPKERASCCCNNTREGKNDGCC